MSFPECIIKFFMERNGVNVITFESGYKENSIYFTNENATDYEFPFDINKVLTALEKNKLDNYLKKRFSGDFTRSSTKYWNKLTDIDDNLKKKYESFNSNVIVFLNVPFDTSQVKASYLFDDIYQWIDELILFAEKIQTFISYLDHILTKFVRIKEFMKRQVIIYYKILKKIKIYQ